VCWEEVEAPVVAGGQVAVEVHAVSVNRGEAAGLSNEVAGARIGWDFAGTVLGGGEGWAAGARVLGVSGEGTWAQRIAVPAGQLGQIPNDLDAGVAAALALPALTAAHLLQLADTSVGGLAGRSVAVTGATGAVGTAAVQLASAAGASVTAVIRAASTRTRTDVEADAGASHRLGELGAAVVASELADLPGRPDVVLESVGGPSLSAALEAVAPGGVVISFGSTSEEPSVLPAYWFGGHASAALHGFVVFAGLSARPAGVDLGALAAQAAAGRLHIEVGAYVDAQDLAAVNTAIRMVATGNGGRGKTVLRLR